MALPHLPHLPSVTFFEYHKAVSGLASRLTVHGSLLRNLVFFALIGLVLVFLVTGADELFEKIIGAYNAIGVETLATSSFYSFLRVMAAVGFSVAWSVPAATAIARKAEL